jgi:CheY-like chemotaxis protein
VQAGRLEVKVLTVEGHTPPAAPRGYHILIVEDNPGDIRLMEEAFAILKVPVSLSIATDGIQAIEQLQQLPQDDAIDLILLDLNLPAKDGRAVLSEVKNHSAFASIPVLVLTTSEASRDIDTAYKLHANCYLTKPNTFDDLLELVQLIDRFWLRRVKLPSRAA